MTMFILITLDSYLKTAMNLYPQASNSLNYNRNGHKYGSYNRPLSAPPHENVKQQIGNIEMSRPLSNPNMYDNSQFSNSAHRINMMPPNPSNFPYNFQWFPPQNQPMMYPPWHHQPNFLPVTPWIQNNTQTV